MQGKYETTAQRDVWGAGNSLFLGIGERAGSIGNRRCVELLATPLFSVCVSLFYVIDTGSIGSRARIEMGVTYLPSASIQYILKLFHRGHCSSIDGVLAYIIVPPE